jgi:class 3 adenylate cyclase
MDRIRTWIRTARDRHVVRRSLVTAAVVGSILVLINHADDLVGGQVTTATLLQIGLTLLVPYLVSTASSVAAIQRHRASGLQEFPDQNPNPVLRMARDGRLLYANPASAPITSALGVAVGEDVPSDVLADLRTAAEASPARSIEVRSGWQTFAVLPVAVAGFDFLNLYGTDITASKVVERFPDRNPNPVMRMSPQGTLLYANAASAPLAGALQLSTGQPLPLDLADRLRRSCEQAEPEAIEIQGDGRTYALKPVDIPEFGFINVYGTDITAAREVEKAHRENERLLLNILPASIAARLRGGEMVIADRFDEMTVLFADCVGFTELSSRLTATEVVEMLNRVFSIFDELADRHGLEKIKTIGDAYMVVGGLAPHAADHAERMADMGLEMIAAVARLRAETGLDLAFRVGMHTGPAVAGVIGLKKFIYDVWGDTVNTASRMESQGMPGRVHVTQSTYERLKDAFDFEPRGTMEIKGKGPLATYFLVERR